MLGNSDVAAIGGAVSGLRATAAAASVAAHRAAAPAEAEQLAVDARTWRVGAREAGAADALASGGGAGDARRAVKAAFRTELDADMQAAVRIADREDAGTNSASPSASAARARATPPPAASHMRRLARRLHRARHCSRRCTPLRPLSLASFSRPRCYCSAGSSGGTFN